MKTISQDEIYQFDQKGYLVKKNFIKKNFVKKILNEINSIKLNKKLNVDKYYAKSIKQKNKLILVRIENFYNKSKFLTQLIKDISINKILSKLFKNKPTLFK